MTDYAKLANRLRSFATVTEVDFAPTKHQAEQRAAVMREAADVIEKFSVLEAEHD